MYFFKSLKEEVKEFVLYSNEQMVRIRLVIQDKFSLYFGSSLNLSEDFEVIYYYDDANFIKLYRTNSLQVHIEENFFNQINSYLHPLSLIIRKSTNGTLNSVLQDLDARLDELFNDMRKTQFIPAIRSFTSTLPPAVRTEMVKEIGRLQSNRLQQQAQIDLFLMVDFEKQVQYMLGEFEARGGSFTSVLKSGMTKPQIPTQSNYTLELVEAILRGKYQVKNGVESLSIEGRKKPVFLNQSSSGQQEVIRLLQEFFLSIVLKDVRFRVIEEPEAHLSPLRQSLLVQLMIEMLNTTENEILITTHSDHILNAVLVGAKKFQNQEQGGINHSDIKISFFALDEVSQRQHKVIQPRCFASTKPHRVHHGGAKFEPSLGRGAAQR